MTHNFTVICNLSNKIINISRHIGNPYQNFYTSKLVSKILSSIEYHTPLPDIAGHTSSTLVLSTVAL